MSEALLANPDNPQYDRRREVDDLRSDQRFISAVLDTAGALVVVLDGQGCIVRFNRTCESTTGYAFEEVAGRRFWDLFLIPEEVEPVRRVFEDLRAGHFPNQHENYWVSKAGDRRLITWSNTALLDRNGQVEYIIGTGIDITDRARTEEALRRSEQRYRQFVESTHEGVWVIDADSATSFVNARMAEMLGYTVEEMLGRHLFSFMDERGVEISRNNLERRRLGIKEQHDFEFLRRDGTRLYAILETSPLTDGAGNYNGALALVTDITARKQAEAQITEQNRFIVSVFEALSHPFYVVNARDYSISIANHAALSGATDAATTCYALTHRFTAPCSQRGCVCPLEQVKRTGQPVVVEHSHYDRDGQRRTVEVHCYPVFDDRGQVSQVIEYALDITERKQAEETLVTSEARHRALIETMDEGLALLDHDQTISYVNDALCRMLGYSRGDLLGRIILDVLPRNSELTRHGEFVGWSNGGPGQFEIDLLRKDGRPLPVILAGSSFNHPDGRPSGSLIVVTDVTQLRQTERDLRERTQELAILLDIARQVALIQDLKPLLELILTRLKEAVEFDAASIVELQDDTSVEIVRTNRAALPGPAFGTTERLIRTPLGQRLAIEQRPVVIADIWSDDSLAGEFRAAIGERVAADYVGIHAWLALPLVLEDRTVGIMALGHQVPDHFTERRVELALAFAGQVTLAIERVRLHQRARELAATEERQHLARELHDAVSQTLFSASLSAEVLPRLWDRHPEAGRQCLNELHNLTEAALADMRSLLLELRPTGLADTALDDLLRQLATAITHRSRIPVQVEIGRFNPPPSDVHVALYRIAQEALNNVAKYSDARLVQITLQSVATAQTGGVPNEGGCLELRVHDDGRGFDLERIPRRSMGLEIMRERARLIGAELWIESRIGWGTTVTVTWPERRASAGDSAHSVWRNVSETRQPDLGRSP